MEGVVRQLAIGGLFSRQLQREYSVISVAKKILKKRGVRGKGRGGEGRGWRLFRQLGIEGLFSRQLSREITLSSLSPLWPISIVSY